MRKKKNRNDARRRRRHAARVNAAALADVLTFGAALEITATDADTATPATIQINAYNGGVMAVPTFGAVVVDLAGLTAADSIPILADHDNRLASVIGAGRPEVRDGALFMAGTISRTNDIGRRVIDLAADGVQLQASIGATPENSRRVKANTPTTVNGRTIVSATPFILIQKSKLREISIVPAGADETTAVDIAAAQPQELITMNFDTWLSDLGLDADALDADQLDTLKKAYEATQSAEPAEEAPAEAASEETATPETVTASIRAAAAGEAARIADIRRVISTDATYQNETRDGQPIEAHAIANDWTAEKTELELIRSTRSKAPAAHIKQNDPAAVVQNIEAALLIRAGVDFSSAVFSSPQAYAAKIPAWLRGGVNAEQAQQALEAGYKYSTQSAVDHCRHIVTASGRTVPLDRAEMIQAAFSTQTLSDIFTNSVGAVLLQTYAEAPDTTAEWASTADVPNFLTNERPRMAVGPGLSKLAAGSEAAHIVRSDAKESYAIARYASQFVVDEIDITNDNLNAMASLPKEMGAAAARLRPDLVYSILLANGNLDATSAALFSAGNNNLNTSSALAQATVSAMQTDMATQQENSANLNIAATHLIVPQALRHTAAQIVNSSEIQSGGSALGNLNPIQSDGLKIASDSRLDNGVTDPASGTAHAGSATTWFAASATSPTIEVGYLAGTGRAPVVRSSALTQGKWGIAFDVKQDIGAKALDFRALHKSTA